MPAPRESSRTETKVSALRCSLRSARHQAGGIQQCSWSLHRVEIVNNSVQVQLCLCVGVCGVWAVWLWCVSVRVCDGCVNFCLFDLRENISPHARFSWCANCWQIVLYGGMCLYSTLAIHPHYIALMVIRTWACFCVDMCDVLSFRLVRTYFFTCHIFPNTRHIDRLFGCAVCVYISSRSVPHKHHVCVGVRLCVRCINVGTFDVCGNNSPYDIFPPIRYRLTDAYMRRYVFVFHIRHTSTMYLSLIISICDCSCVDMWQLLSGWPVWKCVFIWRIFQCATYWLIFL